MRVVSVAPAGSDHAAWSTYSLGLRPTYVLQIALTLLVVANVGRIPVLDLGDRVAPLLVNDLAVGAALATGAIYILGARSLRLNDVALMGFLFACIGGLSALSAIPRFGLSGIEILGSLAYLARWMFYFALYVVIINCVRVGETETLWLTLERAMLMIAAFGIVQSIFLPNFAFIVYSNARVYNDWDPQGHRLVSTILEPNVASGMLAATLMVQLARIASGVKSAPWKPIVMFAAFVMTISRGGTFAFLVGCLVLLAVLGARKPLLRFGVVLFVLFLPLIPKFIAFGNQYGRFGIGDDSAATRVRAWIRASETFLEHPWFGIGFNTYGFVQERRGFERMGGVSYSTEGGLLFIAVMTGVVGLAVFLTMLWVAMRRFRRAWRDGRATPSERGLLIGTAAATVVIFVDTVFVNTLFVPFVMEILWVLWGISFLIATDLKRRTVAHG